MLLVCGVSGAAALPPGDALPLRHGHPLTATISGGERHSHRFALEAKHAHRVVVIEDAVDVAVGVDGDEAVDAPLHGFGRETLLLASAPIDRIATVTVHAVETGASGAYTIELQRLEAKAAVTAETLMTAAGRAAAGADDHASRRTAAAGFGAAAQAWARAGRVDDRAHALHAQCELERRAGGRAAAIGHCEQARELWRAEGEQRFGARATTRLGLLYGEVGRGADAARAHRTALEQFERSGDRRGQATASVNLGLLLHYQGDLDGALERYRAALAIYAPLDQRSAIANLHNNIGGIHYLRGEAQAAQVDFQRAVEMQRRIGNRDGEASALGNLALLQRDIGDLQTALATQLEVLEIRRERADRDGEARARHNIGSVYLSLGELERAQEFLAKALQLRRASADRVGVVATLRSLALVAVALDDPALATRYALESEALADAAQLRDARAAARAVHGQILLRIDRAPEARARYSAAAAEFHELGDPRREASAMLGMARTMLVGDEHASADTTARAALALIADDGYRPLQAEAQLLIAQIAHAAGRGDVADAASRSALAMIESLRGRIGTPELRASYAATTRAAYELAVELAVARASGAAEALEIAERVRARSFNQLLAEPRLRDGRGGGPQATALRARYEDLLGEVGARDSAAVEGRRVADADTLRAELDAVETELRTKDPAFAGLRAPRALSAVELRGLIDADTTVLEYMVGERQSFLWVVTRDDLRVLRLAPRTELEPLVRRVIDAWSRRVQGVDPGADAALLAQLLLPADALAGARSRLVVIPDGPLEYLPFAALPRAGGRRLLDDHAIVMLPSLSALATQRSVMEGRGAAPHTLALVADPVFDRLDPRAPPCHGTACAEAAPMPAFPRLAGSGEEARLIGALAAADGGYRAYGVDATREAIVAGALRGHRIVHLATHGVLDARVPERTGLMFARVGAHSEALDGFLGLRDVAALELDADLVVLSACDTALGREIRGEGLASLTRGFMHAGARRVLATLWRVSDRASGEAMRRFYTALLRDGLPADAALRRAQRELAQDRRWSDPYYWAAFTMQGDWRG